MTDEPQRRDHDRKQLRGNGRFFLTPSAALEVRLLDVSLRGAAVVASANLPLNATGSLHFAVPDPQGVREWFQADTAVVSSVLSADADGFRLSLKFEASMADKLRVAIERYVSG